MPEYRIQQWNEDNSPIDNPYTRMVLRKRLWSKLSNYIRLHALNTEGGIYLDTDVEVLRRFDPLLGDRCFLGFQVPWHATDWVNNAVLGAEPGHPFVKSCMQLTRQLFAQEKRIYRSPAVSTLALKAMGLREYGLQTLGDVKLYPREFFYPHSWDESYSPDRITPNTYSVHHWAGSWVKTKPLLVSHVFERVKAFRRAVGLTTTSRAA